jgi:thiol-disulfide isomerase/thioredoxin
MIEIIDVKENHNIDKFNAAAKRAHDNPDTHGLLVKIYADWCGHCQNMKAEWTRLIDDLSKHYRCKKPGCILTIANIQAVNLEANDPVIQQLKYIPKDIQGVPLIMYVSKGKRGLEYSNDRVYSEMLKWVVGHSEFKLEKRDRHHNRSDSIHHARPHARRSRLRKITKNASIKFKEFHRDTLKRFHKKMQRDGYVSVNTRIPTPHSKRVPAYLR